MLLTGTRKSTNSMTHKTRLKRARWKSRTIFLLMFLSFMVAIALEIRTSRLQSLFFSRVAKDFSYTVENGSSDVIRFPKHGPYDTRLGYDRIPMWTENMTARGYAVSRQARWSDAMRKYTDLGTFPIYDEKAQAGLLIEDRQHRDLMRTYSPQRAYPEFDAIPPILIEMLLFIENRHLLKPDTPYANPAVEWKRQLKALIDFTANLMDQGRSVAGGSTLATQIEKFRHSPDGVTVDAQEKLRQLVSASFRAYRTGERTEAARKNIVFDFINSMPLAATRGFGEVSGLGDGLWAWYGLEFETVNRMFAEIDVKAPNAGNPESSVVALKSALSLFLAQRRPTDYLTLNPDALEQTTNKYLRLMAAEGLISDNFRDIALNTRLILRQQAPLHYPVDIANRKAANPIRTRLLSTLEINSAYALDRLDLIVGTTIDADLQRAATEILNALKDPANVQKYGLRAPYLLDRGDPSKVVYSFSLYERTAQGNLLRVQTNSFEGPFNIDEQTKLDLGSSAKLRTLVHYLEIITALYDRYAGMTRSELKKINGKYPPDPLSLWAVNHLVSIETPDLSTMLDAAMNRTYSASPAERFFTGGGLHTFANFRPEENAKVMTVREAFSHSVNLVFIRMMRDISFYHVFQRYGVTPRMVEKLDETEKKRLLSIFADKEGIVFIKRFYEKYQFKSGPEARDLLLSAIRPTPWRLAAVDRYLRPSASIEDFSDFLDRHLPGSKLKEVFVRKLYDAYDPENLSLADIGYLANVHPLELWVVRQMTESPDATLPGVIAESAEERQAVYRWLFTTKRHHKQYQRIRTIIELEAFQDIHKAWQRTGYPFDSLVPSYATAIGSSADRPGALAELVGIVQNHGVRYPHIRIESLCFGKNTPYETHLALMPPEGERVMDSRVAQVVKKALISVVAEGTARRLHRAVALPDGTYLPIGGKTGTGDHRFKTFGPGGDIVQSKVMNRAATIVFTLGDQHFGTMSAFVAGGDAKNYAFSSSLPVHVLKMILPDLVPGLIVSQH